MPISWLMLPVRDRRAAHSYCGTYTAIHLWDVRYSINALADVQAIDVLALHLPNKLILPDALQFAQEAINLPEVHVRAAACTVIVDVAEGCSDALRKKLLPVLQVRLALSFIGSLTLPEITA